MKKYQASICFGSIYDNDGYTEVISFNAENRREAKKKAKAMARALACQYGEDAYMIEEIWEVF